MSEPLPSPGPGVLATPFEGGSLLVYAPDPGRIQVLNPTAALVWEGCAAGMALADLVEAVVEASGEAPERIRSDVVACVTDLRAARLVVDAAGASSGDAPSPAVGPPLPTAPAPAGRVVGPVAVVDRRLRLVGARADAVHHHLLDGAGHLLVDLVSDVGAPASTASGGSLRRAEPSPETVVVEVANDGGVRQWGPGPGYRAFADADTWLRALPTELNRLLVAQPRCLVLHAAGVVAPDGTVVVLPAPSGSGKSTLTAQAVGAGWRYLSDESVGLRPATLAVVPYPKPLVLDAASRGAVGHPDHLGDNVVVAALGGAAEPAGIDHAPPAAVVVPRYRPGAAATWRPLVPVDALTVLAPEVLNLRAAGVDALATLARLVTTVPCAELVHGGGADALAALARGVGCTSARPATDGGGVTTPGQESS